MSKLTDEQIQAMYDECDKKSDGGNEFMLMFARANESAVTEPLLQRIAELERKSDQDDETIIWQAKKISEKTDKLAELERQLEEVWKDAERWNHACKGNNKNINVCSWDADSYEFVGYAMKKEAIDAIADAEIAAMQKGQA